MAKRRKETPSATDGLSPAMSHTEIAEVLHVSRALVGIIERRALMKLRRNPKMRRLFDAMKEQQINGPAVSHTCAARVVNSIH